MWRFAEKFRKKLDLYPDIAVIWKVHQKFFTPLPRTCVHPVFLVVFEMYVYLILFMCIFSGIVIVQYNHQADFSLPMNWSMEQLKPKAVASFMKAEVGTKFWEEMMMRSPSKSKISLLASWFFKIIGGGGWSQCCCWQRLPWVSGGTLTTKARGQFPCGSSSEECSGYGNDAACRQLSSSS